MAQVKQTKKETAIEIDEGTEAQVTEVHREGQPPLKTVKYNAQVTQSEITEADPEADIENEFGQDDFGLPFVDEENQTEIPKTQLERMFDNIRSAVIENRLNDSFFASVIRMPDNMTVRYARPCGSQIDLGVFQFTSRDMFNFSSAIQERNGNSGGIFNIRIYTEHQRPLVLYRRSRLLHETQEIEVGLVNFSVPDPVKAPDTLNGNGSGNIENSIAQLLEANERRFDAILQQVNRPREKSTLEAAIEQKVLHDILNPPQPNNNGNNIDGLQASMIAMFTAPEMAKKMIEKAFPETPPPIEPDWLDKAGKILELPAAQRIVERVGDIGEAIAVSKLQGSNNPAETVTDANEKDDTQMLLETVIAELESDNALDSDNVTIQEFRESYPDAFDDLQTTCQTLPFESVFALLINKSSKMQPSPFLPFLDTEATQKANKFVWNERGNRMLERLQVFYEYVKVA